MNHVLSLIKEVKLTSDIQEIVRLFMTGKWIMIDATEQGSCVDPIRLY